MAEQKGAGSSKAPQTDKHGNPHGTTYTEGGTPLNAEGQPLDGGKHLPIAKEGEPAIMYNEDGSVFTLPADSADVIRTFTTDIAGLNLAVNKTQNMIDGAQAMADMADEADKKIFDKNINSMKVALDSNKGKKEELEQALAAYRLSLITPAQRADTKLLAILEKQKDEILSRLEQHRNKMKVYQLDDIKKEGKAAPPITFNQNSTPEQKAAYEAAIKEHGTQGKAIVALVKQGVSNAEIAKKLGINPANVPGPKNVFLRSEEGIKWLAAQAK